MPNQRPKKVYRLNYHQKNADFDAAMTILGNPGEIKISTGPKNFVSIEQDSITLAGGFPAKINIQGMSSSLKYGGMLQDLPFPMSVMPVTVATPFPKQVFSPPLMDVLPTIREISLLLSTFVGA